jgi:hypothetical protein
MVVYSVSVLFYSYSSLVCIVTAFGMSYRAPIMSTSSVTGVLTMGSKDWTYVGVMSIKAFPPSMVFSFHPTNRSLHVPSLGGVNSAYSH